MGDIESLYTLTGDYLKLYEMADDPDIDADAWFDTMEGIEGAIEDKAVNYYYMIKNFEADRDAFKAKAAKFKEEAERLETHAKTFDTHIKGLKSRLANAMVATGKTKFKNEEAGLTFWTQDTASVKLAEDLDTTKVPVDYLTFKDPDVDKRKVLADLKAGKTFDFAELVTTTGVRYR